MADDELLLDVGDGQARVPIRSLWLLYLYASSLYEEMDEPDRVEAEDTVDAVDALVTRILVNAVRMRMRRELSPAYTPRHETVAAVRDRIDHLSTLRGGHLQRGRVVCSFEELSVDTPRNRYVLSALDLAARRLDRIGEERDLIEWCHILSAQMQRSGVTLAAPVLATPRREVYGHFDKQDRRMMLGAQFLLESVLPRHGGGADEAAALRRDQQLLTRLFSDAMRGFYGTHLQGWREGKRQWSWPGTPAKNSMFPPVAVDMTWVGPDAEQWLVNAKMCAALRQEPGRRKPAFKREHLYEVYTQMRTVERSARAQALILYPATDRVPLVDKTETIHGHAVRIATVDLAQPPAAIREQLLRLVPKVDAPATKAPRTTPRTAPRAERAARAELRAVG